MPGKDIGMTEKKVKMKFYPVFLVNKKYLNTDIKKDVYNYNLTWCNNITLHGTLLNNYILSLNKDRYNI